MNSVNKSVILISLNKQNRNTGVFFMFDRNPLKTLYGTALEGWENSNYQYLVDKYDEHTADMLVKEVLNEAGVTLVEFHGYRKVRGKMQQGEIRFGNTIKEAEKIARGAEEPSEQD